MDTILDFLFFVLFQIFHYQNSFTHDVLSSISFSYLYQIAHLGDDDEEPEFSSAMPLEEGDTFFFQPRPLKNLVLVDEQENLSPIMSCQVRVCLASQIPRSCNVVIKSFEKFLLFLTDC